MRWAHHERPRRVEIAAYMLLIAAVMAVAGTGYRAATSSTAGEAPAGGGDTGAPRLGERVAHSVGDALRAVERDPFHPERRRPLERYVLPEPASDATASRPGPAPVGAVRLLGTAVGGSGGGFVMCQLGRSAPKVLHVGDTLGGLTLRSIQRAAAEFTDGDGAVVTLHLPGTSSASE